MIPPIRLHGLELEADDALRLNVAALSICGDALNGAVTFADYETAGVFLRTSMLDAITLMGASIADLVRFTELDPGLILDLLGDTFQPFTPGGNL